MAKAESSGTLLFRKNNGNLEVLIVRPSGNEQSTWSIPKGKIEKGETLEEAARRETWEETGVVADKLKPLGLVVYKSKSKKKVHCFCGEINNADPKCASWEVDRAEFVNVEKAKEILHPAQQEFIPRLLQHLKI